MINTSLVDNLKAEIATHTTEGLEAPSLPTFITQEQKKVEATVLDTLPQNSYATDIKIFNGNQPTINTDKDPLQYVKSAIQGLKVANASMPNQHIDLNNLAEAIGRIEPINTKTEYLPSDYIFPDPSRNLVMRMKTQNGTNFITIEIHKTGRYTLYAEIIRPDGLPITYYNSYEDNKKVPGNKHWIQQMTVPVRIDNSNTQSYMKTYIEGDKTRKIAVQYGNMVSSYVAF